MDSAQTFHQGEQSHFGRFSNKKNVRFQSRVSENLKVFLNIKQCNNSGRKVAFCNRNFYLNPVTLVCYWIGIKTVDVYSDMIDFFPWRSVSLVCELLGGNLVTGCHRTNIIIKAKVYVFVCMPVILLLLIPY